MTDEDQVSPSDASLIRAVQVTCAALDLGPEDAGVVRLAEVLASTVDGMDAGVRERMLGQTAGQLLRALEVLRGRVRPVDPGEARGLSTADLDAFLRLEAGDGSV